MATEEEDPLKPALWASIGALVDSLTASLPHSPTPTSQFIGALAEMVYAQIQGTATEVESFARHAGRTVITKDDALMLARKNEGLEKVLKAALESQRST